MVVCLIWPKLLRKLGNLLVVQPLARLGLCCSPPRWPMFHWSLGTSITRWVDWSTFICTSDSLFRNIVTFASMMATCGYVMHACSWLYVLNISPCLKVLIYAILYSFALCVICGSFPVFFPILWVFIYFYLHDFHNIIIAARVFTKVTSLSWTNGQILGCPFSNHPFIYKGTISWLLALSSWLIHSLFISSSSPYTQGVTQLSWSLRY